VAGLLFPSLINEIIPMTTFLQVLILAVLIGAAALIRAIGIQRSLQRYREQMVILELPLIDDFGNPYEL